MNKFVLTDGNGKYICKDQVSNKYAVTTNENRAVQFDSRLKAANVLKSSIASDMKRVFRVQEFREDYVKPSLSQDSEKPQSESIQTVQDANSAATLRVDTDAINEGIKQWLYKAAEIFSKADDIRNQLNSELSECDCMLTDIHHHIELNGFNACQGYKLAKRMQVILKERRRIKDCMYILNTLRGAGMNEEIIGQMIENVKRMDDRKYFPRVIEDVYENPVTDKT